MDVYTRFILVQLVGVIGAGYIVNGMDSEFNPFGQRYLGYRNTGWSVYLTDGSLSAGTADYKPVVVPRQPNTKTPCVRVVVFMAHGAVLDHLETDCDTPESTAGLFTQESALRYLDTAVVRQEAAGRFLLVRKTGEKDKCSRKLFVLGESSDSKGRPSPEVKVTEDSSDISCNHLNDVPLSPMLLFSSTGGLGEFQPVSSEWMTYNPWEPLGFVSREYQHNNKCFRLLVVTSSGRAVHSVKLTCGPVSGVTSTGHSLHLGDTLYASVDSKDKFTVLLNIHDNHCVKKTISVEEKGGSTVRNVRSTDSMVSMQDNDCRRLVKGEVQDNTLPRDKVSKLKTSPIKNEFKQDILKPFTATGELLDYNLARDMGMMVQTYTKEDKTQNNIVTLVARGVLVLPVIVEAGPPRRIVIQDNAVYYDRDVAFTKLYADGGYQVLKRLDEGHCWRKLFKVKGDGSLEGGQEDNIDKNLQTTKGEGSKTETATTKPQGNILNDKDCKNLIEGTHLRTNEALPFVEMEQVKG